MINGIFYLENFVKNPYALLQSLVESVQWDLSMQSRKTASFGVAYNYPPIKYPELDMPLEMEEFCKSINKILKFKPNNCLINLYADGNSKMGFHSDQIDILAEHTGVAIISLGEERILRFRQIEDKDLKLDFPLSNGSLFYMNQEIQEKYQHSIPRDKTTNPRMSLTFRKLKQN